MRTDAVSGDVLELAQLGSLAARIEPQLLRSLRLELAPRLRVETEADFWFSDLVATRARTGVVLRPEALNDLRSSLAAEPERLDAAWRITQRVHEQGSPTLLAEEELTYLCARGLDADEAVERAQSLLRRLLATLVDGERVDMTNWAGRALLRLPNSLMRFEEAKQLVLAASYRGAEVGELLASVGEGRSGDRWLLPANARSRTLGVRLVEGGVEFCATAAPEALEIEVPPGRAVTITVSDPLETDETVTLDPHRTAFLERSSQQLELQVHGGSRYRLRRRNEDEIAPTRRNRVRISYSSPFVSEQTIELPFVIGVLAPLVPLNCEGALESWDARKIVDLTSDSYDALLARISPSITIEEEITLTFRSLGDFRPDRIARALPSCAALLARKTALTIATATVEAGEADAVQSDFAVASSAGSEGNALAAWRKRLFSVGMSAPAIEDMFLALRARSAERGSRRGRVSLSDAIAGAIADIETSIAASVAAVLRDPRFRDLESAWRGLRCLLENAPPDARIKIRVLPCSSGEVEREVASYQDDSALDASPLFRTLFEIPFGTLGGEPYGLIVSDWAATHRPEDFRTLSGLARLGAAINCVVLANAHPNLMRMDSWTEVMDPRNLSKLMDVPEYDEWRTLRKDESTRWLALCMPRVLSRRPYGPKGDPVADFKFAEAPEYFPYMNSAYLFAANVARAFSLYGWFARIRGNEGGIVSDLFAGLAPALEGGDEESISVEVTISNRREVELAEAGLISLLKLKNTDRAVFFSARSLYKPPSAAAVETPTSDDPSARLPCMFGLMRFVHAIRCMVRDSLGSQSDLIVLESWINSWLSQYVEADLRNASEERKARRPLQYGRFEVVERREAHCVRSRLSIRPRYQMENVAADISVDFDLLIAPGFDPGSGSNVAAA